MLEFFHPQTYLPCSSFLLNSLLVFVLDVNTALENSRNGDDRWNQGDTRSRNNAFAVMCAVLNAHVILKGGSKATVAFSL